MLETQEFRNLKKQKTEIKVICAEYWRAAAACFCDAVDVVAFNHYYC